MDGNLLALTIFLYKNKNLIQWSTLIVNVTGTLTYLHRCVTYLILLIKGGREIFQNFQT